MKDTQKRAVVDFQLDEKSFVEKAFGKFLGEVEGGKGVCRA